MAVFILQSIGQILWGFKPNLMAHMVEQKGAARSVFWFATNMPRYQGILKKWGPIRTHLIATFISTFNGCAYCTHGHAYAFQLHYLQKFDVLFPMDEQALITLHTLPEQEAMLQIEHALSEAGLGEEILHIRQSEALRHTASVAASQEDVELLHLISMFSVLNECGIKGDVAADQAHDPINRNHELRKRYSELRTRETTS